MLLRLIFTFVFLVAAPYGAHAQCTAPDGNEGDQVYNSTHKVMQFCDGDEWVGMARVPPAPGGAGDNFGSHVAEQDIDAGGNKITDLGPPVDGNDAANKAYVDSLVGGTEIDPQVGLVTNGKWCTSNGTLINCDAAAPEVEPGLIVVAETLANNTNPGAAAVGAWTDRVLNRVYYNNLDGAELGVANDITLPEGTYYIDASIPFYGALVAQTRLVRASDGSPILSGSRESAESESVIRGTFHLGGLTAVKIQYFASATASANDLGYDLEAGIEETYAVVSIRRVATGVVDERPIQQCSNFVMGQACDDTGLDPATALFTYSSGYDQSACAAACAEAGAACCTHTSANGCFGTTVGGFSSTTPPAGWSASLCDEPEPPGPPTTAHFVLVNVNASASQGGLAGANYYCNTALKSYDWKGKLTAAIGPTNVKAFLCDSATCNNMLPSTEYAFATTGNTSYGGATFTTDPTGAGPNDSANWSGATYFGVSTTFWSNRTGGFATVWGNTPGTGHCSNWASTTGTPRYGTTASGIATRWDASGGSCGTARPFVCIVDPVEDSHTCVGKGGVEVGGACWFLSAGGEGCGYTCADLGMFYDGLTETYAGSTGSNGNCTAVLDALTGVTAAAPTTQANAMGCYKIAGTANGTRYRGTTTTTAYAQGTSTERACACKFTGSGDPCLDAGGVSVGGACWFMGGLTASCDTVCTNWVGGTYNTATLSYAGSGGSNANCGAVLTALSAPGLGASTNIGNAAGCQISSGSVRNRGTTATTSAASGSYYRACACDPPVVIPDDEPTGSFVMTNVGTPADMGGWPGAKSICISKLKAYDWMGKDDAVINSTTVKPFLCKDEVDDTSKCGDPLPSKEYNFAVMGSPATGGASFTVNASGRAPNNAANWSGATYFGGNYTYWSNRKDPGTNTLWESPGSGGFLSCTDWTNTGAMAFAGIGTTNATTSDRWTNNMASCTSGNPRMVCVVDPDDGSSSNDCTVAGGVEVGGACWFLGDEGESCTSVCSMWSATYNSATLSYAGSGGDNTNCNNVLTALDAGGSASTNAVTGAGGCSINEATGARTRGTTATTPEASAGSSYHRACACTPPEIDDADTECVADGGVPVGNTCWFLSATSASCDTRCSAANGRLYDTATMDYAGSNGTNLNCGKILYALGQGSAPTAVGTTWGGAAYGCAKTGSTLGRGTGATTSAASQSNYQRACACKPAPPPSFFVRTNGTWNGGLGGMSGANAKCLSDLTANSWLGKSEAVLNSSTVKAFICDGSTCNNLYGDRVYTFARSGAATTGGATFTTDASGRGPNNSTAWNTATTFGTTSIRYWSNRAYESTTKWSILPDDEPVTGACMGWLFGDSMFEGKYGQNAQTNYNRWAAPSDTDGCDNTFPLVCIVDPPPPPNGTAHVVMTNGTFNGNLGGLAGANEKCLADLTANDWMGKSGANLHSRSVKALLCDGDFCQGLNTMTTYAYARSGSPATGGATFSSGFTGMGPNDSTNWTGATRFGITANWWSNRQDPDDSDTIWGNTVDTGTDNENCVNWTSSSSGNGGRYGSTNSTNRTRWTTGNELACNTSQRLICIVNPN